MQPPQSTTKACPALPHHPDISLYAQNKPGVHPKSAILTYLTYLGIAPGKSKSVCQATASFCPVLPGAPPRNSTALLAHMLPGELSVLPMLGIAVLPSHRGVEGDEVRLDFGRHYLLKLESMRNTSQSSMSDMLPCKAFRS